MSQGLMQRLNEMEAKIHELESRFAGFGYQTRQIVQSEFKTRWKILPQAETLFGMMTALCVETVDPWKQNRVRFYSPFMHDPNTPVKSLPWANAISPMGGIDDSGCNWVPPAGSTLCLTFEDGDRNCAYYLGTTWHRYNGTADKPVFNYNVDEYFRVLEPHRRGYLVGANDGSQSLPQWATESYNGFDIDSISDFDSDPEAQRKITIPNIYGMKTLQKHSVKLVDGDPNCNHRWKRFEIQSSCGGWLCFKDDHMHPSGQWAHPNCNCGDSGDVSSCTDENGDPIEQVDTCSGNVRTEKCANPYFKHENECRPYRGPQTPQNNKAMLDQCGFQVLSHGGATFYMDDSVEEPVGIPEWELSTKPFSFGCTDKFTGKTGWISVTGHEITMSDVEEDSQLRGNENFIRLKSALGNRIELNDHTVGGPDCSESNVAGDQRGITFESTSKHIFQMIDTGCKQDQLPCRKSGGEPQATATDGYMMMQTGYGLTFIMGDSGSQEETQQQYITLFCPQKDNQERGPHLLTMEEAAEGPGQVFWQIGGNFLCSTYDGHYTYVGDKDKNPSDKLTYVTNDYMESTEKFYFNTAETHAFQAKDVILLMAGEDDCSGKDGCEQCIWPVLCWTPKGITISDRVFVSASPEAQTAPVTGLSPFNLGASIPPC